LSHQQQSRLHIVCSSGSHWGLPASSPVAPEPVRLAARRPLSIRAGRDWQGACEIAHRGQSGEGRHTMSAKFAIFRRENTGGYSSRGPVALKMTLEQSRCEMMHLKKRYPHQEFVIMGEVDEAMLGEELSVQIEVPDQRDQVLNGHSA
jgi:hypothetical protein